MDTTIKEFKHCKLFVRDFGEGNVDIMLSGDCRDTRLCDLYWGRSKVGVIEILEDLAESLVCIEDPDKTEVATAVLNYLVEIGY